MFGWVVMRAAMLTGPAPAIAFQDRPGPAGPTQISRSAATATSSAFDDRLPFLGRLHAVVSLQAQALTRHAIHAIVASLPTTATAIPNLPIKKPVRLVLASDLQTPYAPATAPVSQAEGVPSSPRRDRFQLSAWALIRDAAVSRGLVPGGTLGGSQIGARGWFEPGPEGLALTARVSSPLASRYGSEASVGLGIRKGNFGVILEERLPLDAASSPRPSLTAFGGVSDVRLRGKLRLDAYAQAGVVGLQKHMAFADGSMRIEHPLVGKATRLSAGAGVWGGAQTGVTRLDVGPQIVARLPVAGGALRAAGEWRFRVAGNADPGSGPALSIGMDF